jgi:hypothetical protein
MVPHLLPVAWLTITDKASWCARRRTTMTYSILGYDAANGDLGVAVQSKFPGVGSLVPYGEAEVGVVATQAFGNPVHGSNGLMLLRCGATPQQAVHVLLNDDRLGHKRQFALVDRGGAVAAHTGADLPTWDGWSGNAAGNGCVALARRRPVELKDFLHRVTGWLARREREILVAAFGSLGIYLVGKGVVELLP